MGIISVLDDPNCAQCWEDRVNAMPEFRLASRLTDAVDLRLHADARFVQARIDRSQFIIISNEKAREPTLTIRGSTQAWADFCSAIPTRFNHHILAMDRFRDDFAISGSWEALLRHLRVIDLSLQALRLPIH